ncbi:hypothetical protein RJT34_05754 [Clitoria ternatea]|uniref:BHLH domain-containing protein n=1 Tax=Clitoria ternatea TaxID=43366 RepID=A0AAN9PTW3_CLITE
MDVDTFKASTSDMSSMDMITMMMQMEKFPEFSEPFYNTYSEDHEYLSSGTSTTITTFPNVNQNAVTPLPSLSNPSLSPSSFINNPFSQQPMPMNHPLPPNNSSFSEKKNSVAAMREMIFRVAVMQPIHIDPESIKPPKRRNVKISKDPQSVAARHRRERISERIRILQRLVPGGTKMDTASMLDEAIHYVKFLKKQVQTLEQQARAATRSSSLAAAGLIFPSNSNVNYSAFNIKGCQPCQMFGSASKQMLS